MSVRGGSTDTLLPAIAADLVGSTNYQVVKLDLGAAGASAPILAATAARTSVAAAVADTALLAASTTRVGVTVFNESTSILYVGYGAAAVSLTDYSVQVPAYGLLEVPLQFVQCAIRGYWATATGSARITAG